MAAPLAGQGCILGLHPPQFLFADRDPDPDPDVNRRHTDAHALVEPAVSQPNGRGADPKPRAQPAAAASSSGTPLSGLASRAPVRRSLVSGRRTVAVGNAEERR